MALPDVRTYDDVSAVGAVSSGFTALTGYGSDLYGRILQVTPGLVHFFRFGAGLANVNGTDSTYAPYFLNSAGAIMLGKVSGSPTAAAALTVGGLGSVRLNNGSLWAFDYFSQTGAHEVGSFEAWFKPLSIPADGAVMGQWASNVGWLMHLGTGGVLTFNIGSVGPLSSASGAIVTGSTYHIVAVVGGTQVPDYISRLYINGVEVDTGNWTGSEPLYTTGDQLRIGNYAGGAGSTWDGYISEVAIYSRMLQPNEVYQHYQAGLGVLWP